MNTDIFKSLREIMNSLERSAHDNPLAILEIREQCEKALHLIQLLQFSDNSAHIQLTTKQALQYIQRALQEARVYSTEKGSLIINQKGKLMDICGPAHASLEIILNLNYN